MLQPLDFSKFNLVLLSRNPVKNTGNTQFYYDIDNNGQAEKLYFANNTTGHLFFYLYDHDNRLVEQFNCDHPTVKTHSFIHPLMTDSDGDGFSELFVFTQNHDTILLNCFDFETVSWTKKNVFVTTIGNEFSTGENFTIQWITEHTDEENKLYFVINAGYSMFPRRLFAYNVTNNKFIRSVNTGSPQRVNAFYKKNGDIFFLSITHAAFNCRASYPYPYHDTCVWLFEYDKALRLTRKPKYLPGKGSGKDFFQLSDSSFICTYWNYGTYGHPGSILNISSEGEITDSLNIHSFYAPRMVKLNVKKTDHYFLIAEKNDKIVSYLYDPTRNECRKNPFRKLNFLARNPLNYDVDHDGVPELILQNPIDNRLTIQSNNLIFKTSMAYPVPEGYITNISSKFENGAYHVLLTTNKSLYDLNYVPNHLHVLQIPFYLLIYFLCSVFIVITMYYYRQQIEYSQRMERRIAGLQLQNFKNQLDPHFTFNALNSVASAIYKEDKKTAYDLFQRFSEMVRSSLHTADKVLIPLGDELQFTEDYLEFQKIRFKDKFSYEIQFKNFPDLNRLEIPKLLLQGIVENAVKHAFYGIDYKGHITIRIDKKAQENILIIEDNGIGINASKDVSATKGNGVGLNLLNEQLIRINKLFQKSYVLVITDLSSAGGKGTRVELVLG